MARCDWLNPHHCGEGVSATVHRWVTTFIPQPLCSGLAPVRGSSYQWQKYSASSRRAECRSALQQLCRLLRLRPARPQLRARLRETPAQADKSIRLAQSALEEIALLFESARKTSKRYDIFADGGGLVAFEDKDMNPTGRALHHELRVLARSRQERTSLARKTAWALYDGKALEKVVSQIAVLVDELEKITPLETPGRKLAEIEIQEVEDEASLAMLEEAARAVDPPLLAATVRKIAGRGLWDR